MSQFKDLYRGRRVLVTGHTGFKGSWLVMWLQHLGADVSGFSDRVSTTPAMFDLLDLGEPGQPDRLFLQDDGRPPLQPTDQPFAAH